MSGTLTTIMPDGSTHERRWLGSKTPPWETLKECVGGYVERVQVRWAGKIRTAYVNENGVAEGCQYNNKATMLVSERYMLPTGHLVEIVGPLVIWIPDPKVKP